MTISRHEHLSCFYFALGQLHTEMMIDPSSTAAPAVSSKMMTSIRTSEEGGLEIVDQLLLP